MGFGLEAAHYGETRKALVADPVVRRMAADVLAAHNGNLDEAKAAVGHDDGVTPRFEFMGRANAGYVDLGNTVAREGLGAVAEAVLMILNGALVEADDG